MKKTLYLSFVLVFTCCLYLIAQNNTNKIVIYNGSESSISFYLSYDNTNWDNKIYTINASTIKTYNTGIQTKCYIKIETNSSNNNSSKKLAGKSIYELKAGEKYQFYWNSDEQKWDLIKYSIRN